MFIYILYCFLAKLYKILGMESELLLALKKKKTSSLVFSRVFESSNCEKQKLTRENFNDIRAQGLDPKLIRVHHCKTIFSL